MTAHKIFLPNLSQNSFYEVYACHKTYAENYDSGPQFPQEKPLDISDYLLKPPRNFLGLQVANPLGIPAGPLLNAQWVKFYLDFGFAVPVYKTVRSISKPSLPPPNCIYVKAPASQTPQAEFDPEQIYHRALPELWNTMAPETLRQLSITNSFGVPSMAPEVWMPDVELANSYCGEGRALIVSVLGTEGAQGRGLVEDFGYTAAMAAEAGAAIIEANFSCPNLGGASADILHAEDAAQIAKEIRRAVGPAVPVLLKLGPLAPATLCTLVSATRPYVQGYAGINTVPGNVRQAPSQNTKEAGDLALPGRLRSGICGAIIRQVGAEFVRNLAALRRCDDFAIIGVGGMMDAEDLQQRLDDGADLVMSATAAMWDPYLALRWLSR